MGTVNFRLFAANGNGKRTFVFFGRQMINESTNAVSANVPIYDELYIFYTVLRVINWPWTGISRHICLPEGYSKAGHDNRHTMSSRLHI
jgi:hypothetical protein